MEALLTWNRPQFNAMNAKVFHEDVLEMLNAGSEASTERMGLDGNILTLPQAIPLLPTPIEILKNLSVNLKHIAKAL